MKQAQLFEKVSSWPNGLQYQAEFLTSAEEVALLEVIGTLALQEAQYKEYRAKRRILSYGGRYDFTHNELLPAGPIPEFLYPLRERIAQWVDIPALEFNHAVIAEYRPGTQLGWHRDVPDFEVVVGVSLAGSCRMRFRPYPPRQNKREGVFALQLEARSIYALKDAARWGWQHSIPPTKQLRYSITLRTLA